ncbi:cytosolic phospholipase A2 delta-like isoform X2 [Eublepharis macularius]|uniref:Cytosolic phospholipase A2 delta-like isoform X2 n=1 Tax=Eublepharis macularius TaxID=481883 RepID=A0AA97KQ11_EUBMA|nr:cytosolic phospholipase A2 delta-like isoform X2 [Eublepharis macularius]
MKTLFLTQRSCDFERLITNNILVAREVSCLEVQLDKWKTEERLKKHKNIVLLVNESFEEAQKVIQDSESFRFHCVKNWEPMLKVNMKSNSLGEKLFRDTAADCPGVLLKSLPEGKETKVALPLTKTEHLKVQLKVNNCLGALDVRLGCDLCEAERDFLHKRKNVVAAALKKVLRLDQELQGHEVPVLAIMATGGGARAMSAFYGHLFALQKLNLLDCVMYITGASGSTWTMRNLYEDASWSQKDLVSPIRKARKCVTRSKSSAFSMDALKHYDVKLQQRVQEGHSVSFTDLWSLIIDRMFHDELSESKLTNQQQAVNVGQNPLPIYVALNVKESSQSSLEFKEWCEFSPYEVGFPKYGGFISPEDFGSEFFMGRLIKTIPESKICFLEGIWSNIFSLNLMDVWNAAQSSYQFWQSLTPGKEKDDNKDNSPFENQLSVFKTTCFSPPNDLSNILNRVLTHRPIAESTPNFLRGLQLHKDYYQHKTFSAWQETKLDQFPNHLTPLEKELCLVDAGYFINTSCPPLLRKERDVDVILSFDYNLVETRFHSIENTGKCCEEKGIPFPKIVLSEEDRKNPKECYVFMDNENPEVPIVLHFPLVDNSFRKYKRPGIKRSSAEMAKGEMDLTSLKSPYRMTNLTYTEDDFDKLLNLSDYNIQNNSQLILQALQAAIERRKVSKKGRQLKSTSSY